MSPKPQLPYVGIRTFMKRPYQADWTTIDADIAVLGAPFDYGTAVRPGARFGPSAIREASQMHSALNGHYDPDEDKVFLDPAEIRIVDLGDVPMIHFDAMQCIDNIREAVESVAASGAFLLVLGGDHSVHAPCIEGFRANGHNSIHIVHLDAHLDYVDERMGVRYGQGNPLRRAAELPFVSGITHIGIRGVGSSGPDDFRDARATKSRIVTMKEFRRIGVQAALAQIPEEAVVYFTVDIDGFDASLVPGTGTPSYGGLTYDDGIEIVSQVAMTRRCIGMDFVELAPVLDASGASALFASQFLTTSLCQIFRPGTPTWKALQG